MRAGLEWKEGNPAYQALYISRDWVSFMLDKPMVVTPGIQFNYCSGCSHLLSAVITNATGMNTLEYAQSRLFEPLGIQNVYWEKDVNDIPIGGWGLELTPRDMAKFGYLYLHNGEWEGKQIIPEKWVYMSTQANQEFKDGWGYGYHWWVNPSNKIYAAQGLHGQKIYVIPNFDMVIVVTAGQDDTSVMWEVVKNFILPSVR